MVDNIKLRIVESQEEILNMIDKPIGTIVNFDWHPDYPLFQEKTFDTDSYSFVIQKNPSWLENNWVPMLVSMGYLSQYVCFFPHDCGKDDVKTFKSKKGNCLAYNLKFNRKTKMSYRHITIDMDFIGCRIPMIWNPDDRRQLFMDVLTCLTARNLTLILSKSKKYVSYDVDEFLDDAIKEMKGMTNVEMI